jgi:hypothetical protein
MHHNVFSFIRKITEFFCKVLRQWIWSLRESFFSPAVALRHNASSFLRFLDHTQRRTTVGRTPLDEWSARRRDPTWQHTTLTTDKHHAPGGIWTQNLSRREAADLRLRPRGHWDQQLGKVTHFYISISIQLPTLTCGTVTNIVLFGRENHWNIKSTVLFATESLCAKMSATDFTHGIRDCA